MQTRNKYLRRIRKLYWDKDEIGALEHLLRDYRYPGAPLNIIAQKLGVRNVILDDMPFDGGIFEENGKTVIRLNALSSSGRQRFTLAHELGHLIFMQRFSVAPDCLDDKDLEDACDQLAAELLMPRRETEEYLRRLGYSSPESLRSIAERFRVSLHFAARRLDDLTLWKYSVGMWELNDQVEQKWFVGKRLWRRPPRFAAFDLARAAVKSVSTRENIRCGDEEIPILLRMLNLGRNVFLGLVMTAT